MKKGAKKKGVSKAGRKATSTSSATKNDGAIVETQPSQEIVETQPSQEIVETQPSQEVEEAAKVESPSAKEAENEEEAKVESPTAKEAESKDEAKEEEQAKPDSSSQQEKDQNVEAKGASSSQPQADEKKEENETPLRHGKRKRSTTNETEKKVNTKSAPRAKRARATKPQAAEPEYFKEKRNLEDLWKDAFPVGTEWGQLDDLYEFNWDFTNLEEALEDDGKLYGKKVYVFGCAESHLVTYKNETKTVLVPAVVCVESSIPPSDKIGISSVEDKEPEITPMKVMKMAWEPYIPLDKRDRQVDRMNFQIYILACTQRRSALKHLKEDRVKKFNYCLPYINNPFKEDESEQSTVVQITFPSEPPVVCEYDWENDNLEVLADDLIKEGLLKGQKDEFQEFVKEQADKAKKAHGEAEEAREKAKEEMSEATKEAYKEMKLYKFYPSPSPNTPDLSAIDKSSFINRYFGKAHQVL
ncbi:unnamed protein product [Microthlaspi erraticum]|uniref:Uncharacterized protein n=1 Tax=Microthlaspi erraticum TaxID=1685480 RepID=A0A6D2JBS2_9BRAS|nr:unnamed protein product [Microthlaspi erraticum]